MGGKCVFLDQNGEKTYYFLQFLDLTIKKKNFFLPPPPLGISGLFRLLCSTSYSWSLTFTSADLPLRVIPDFDLHRNHRGTWRLLVNARILTNLVTSQCELVTIFFSGMRS